MTSPRPAAIAECDTQRWPAEFVIAEYLSAAATLTIRLPACRLAGSGRADLVSLGPAPAAQGIRWWTVSRAAEPGRRWPANATISCPGPVAGRGRDSCQLRIADGMSGPMRERNRGDRRQDTRRPPARHCLAGSPAGRGSGMLIQHGRRRMRGPGDFTPVTKSQERARQGQAAGHGMLDLMDRALGTGLPGGMHLLDARHLAGLKLRRITCPFRR
jgi:hypothetical protein